MDNMKRNGKRLAVCSIFICLASGVFAQDYYGGGNGQWRKRPDDKNQPKDKDAANPEPSGYMSVNFGFAKPEGSFGAGYGSGYGGYAQSGIIYHFSFAFPISHSNFGLAFMFGSSSNNYDINSFVNYRNNSDLYNYYQAGPGSNNVYQQSSIMGGLYVTYPLGRLSIDGRVMIGALLNSLPEQYYGKVDTGGNQTTYDLPTTYPTSFAIDAGIGIRYLIAKFGRRQLCAMINVDYLYSNVAYNANEVVDYTPYTVNPSNAITYESYPTASGNLTISLLNITFGLGYQLGN
jgi:hypothetical protein